MKKDLEMILAAICKEYGDIITLGNKAFFELSVEKKTIMELEKNLKFDWKPDESGNRIVLKLSTGKESND